MLRNGSVTTLFIEYINLSVFEIIKVFTFFSGRKKLFLQQFIFLSAPSDF